MISFQAFSDEFVKIAAKKKDKKWKEWSQEKGRIYDPGVTAHEAGHVRLHKKSPLVTAARVGGTALAALGPAVYLGTQIARDKSVKAWPITAMVAGGMVPVLADEGYASLRGYQALKESGKYNKEELKQMRHKLLAAGGTYAMLPAAALATQAVISGSKKKGLSRPAELALALGIPLAMTAGTHLLTQKMREEKGPAVSAREAKAIAQKIAPGVDVYATDTPIPQGSFAVPKLPKWMHKDNIEAMKPLLRNPKDRKRIVEKGGIMIAPIRPAPRGERV